MTSIKGGPDEARSARVILKDFINAKILHTVPPPMEHAPSAAPRDGDASDPFGPKPQTNTKLPSKPSVSSWFDKMKMEYEAQEQAKGHFTGRKGKGSAAGSAGASTLARGMQWRPAGQSAVPDRMVAQGPRVLLS